MSRKKKGAIPSKPFPKDLLQPIYVVQNLLMPTRTESLRDQISKERIRKLRLLFQHYAINEHNDDRWADLAVSLALEFLPGFHPTDEPPRGPGRPRGKTKDNNFELADDIEEFALRFGVSPSQACTRINNRPRWRPIGHRALYGRYLRHLERFDQKPEQRMQYLREQLKAELERKSGKSFDPASFPSLGLLSRFVEEPVRGSSTNRVGVIRAAERSECGLILMAERRPPCRAAVKDAHSRAPWGLVLEGRRT